MSHDHLDSEYCRLISACMDSGDPLGAYRWANGWIGSGGGATLLDPWLAYVASALMRRQPRVAVHSVDLALKNWIEPDADRAVLLWVRAEIVRRWLKDPRSAEPDYLSAATAAPAWLAERVESSRRDCEGEAAASRKRKASVGPTPHFEGAPNDRRPDVPQPLEVHPPQLFSLVDDRLRAT